MVEKINREITLLKPDDVFLIINRVKKKFDFPIHFHPEYELNFILNGRGVRRVVGNSMEEIGDVELVLVGSNLEHGWETHHCKRNKIYEITIQFHENLFSDDLLSLKNFKPIKDLFIRSKQGVLFDEKTAINLMSKIKALSSENGVDDFIKLLKLLEELANSKHQRTLSQNIDERENQFEGSDKIKKVHDFLNENYARKISLKEISSLVNMSQSSFNRFIKKRTGKTFIEFANDKRIGYATKFLVETDLSVAETAYRCGFNSIANFNRFFKKSKNITPSKFKTEFKSIQRFE
ncbi:AraC family transcriptional regulator [Flaviramulus sp. BrNp1-15]|uniref:AraC family transcriptional regulator n=1 Tax=Flaviramulus sp. BrNp1-15 TaxID=2916754 RepID=UPI001EE95F2F|nr:AraC family transcriptional regulator [Flaviramulus sp. BrNp1-15]ULC60900.1 AraC family transcriptional regulator [Flaviramulus sp. BrNp1-15]